MEKLEPGDFVMSTKIVQQFGLLESTFRVREEGRVFASLFIGTIEVDKMDTLDGDTLLHALGWVFDPELAGLELKARDLALDAGMAWKELPDKPDMVCGHSFPEGCRDFWRAKARGEGEDE